MLLEHLLEELKSSQRGVLIWQMTFESGDQRFFLANETDMEARIVQNGVSKVCTSEDISKLLREFKQLGFWNMSDITGDECLDGGCIDIAIQDSGELKTVSLMNADVTEGSNEAQLQGAACTLVSPDTRKEGLLSGFKNLFTMTF